MNLKKIEDMDWILQVESNAQQQWLVTAAADVPINYVAVQKLWLCSADGGARLWGGAVNSTVTGISRKYGLLNHILKIGGNKCAELRQKRVSLVMWSG